MKLISIRLVLVIFMIALFLQLCGCGETIQGIGKDARRMGKGVKTIFIRESE